MSILLPLALALAQSVPAQETIAGHQTRFEEFSVLMRTPTATSGERGRMFFGAGVAVRPEWAQPFSGLQGTLVQYGVFSFQLAFTDAISVRIDGTLLERLDLDRNRSMPRTGFSSADNPKDAGVPKVSTIIHLVRQRGHRPAFGISFAATVPTTDDTEGIGLDTTDVFGSTLWTWRGPDLSVTGNVGVGILTSPTALREQNDVLTWSVMAVSDWRPRIGVMAEVSGHSNTRSKVFLGTEDRSAVRLGLTWTAHRLRLEAALIQGLTNIEGDLGVGFGVTWSAWRPSDRPGRR